MTHMGTDQEPITLGEYSGFEIYPTPMFATDVAGVSDSYERAIGAPGRLRTETDLQCFGESLRRRSPPPPRRRSPTQATTRAIGRSYQQQHSQVGTAPTTAE